jgi:glutamine---fructose-6-phosphate transaminase (isomerizing)
MCAKFVYEIFNSGFMNMVDNKYVEFGLCLDMMRAADLIRDYDPHGLVPFIAHVCNKRKVFITGEGSSRIFPAKNAVCKSLKYNTDIDFKTEGAIQAGEYNLTDYAVFGVSNSGKTSELVNLFYKLKIMQHDALFAVTAYKGTPLETFANLTHLLKCGNERSIAATISVIEQALFFDLLISKTQKIEVPSLSELSRKFADTLSIAIPKEIVRKITQANIIYFAGRNNGVAEELTLKTNEIIRKRSDYLEGTYAVHGIEEVMESKDVMIIIDPFEDQETRFQKYLLTGAGVYIVAISTRQTIFPTIIIPKIQFFQNYLEMAAGWNILVECGIHLGVNMDKPERARKIGNEYELKINN